MARSEGRHILETLEKYAPPPYDPTTDDLTVPFAILLVEKDREIERLRAALKNNNHHLAKLVNGTDDDDPQTLEQARQQVLATRNFLAGNEQKPNDEVYSDREGNIRRVGDGGVDDPYRGIEQSAHEAKK